MFTLFSFIIHDTAFFPSRITPSKGAQNINICTFNTHGPLIRMQLHPRGVETSPCT